MRGYYARIDKSILFQQVQQHVHHPVLLDLVYQFLHYSVEEGGNFHTPVKGIARSSSLSPLLAAFHLFCVDRHFANQRHLYYRRYMDDFIIFTRSRWHLRQAVRELNQFFRQFGFVQHPDKTFIGPLHKGVDWMGAWFTNQGLCSIAPRALTNHRNTLRRLYEQTRTLSPQGQADRVARYVHRWRRWALSLCSLSACAQRRFVGRPKPAHPRPRDATDNTKFKTTKPNPGCPAPSPA
ncbi:reverse transcriptase domain-containing protein [Serratia sp. T13T92]|uniref:reverse transcriptase domain-containing protein n=1 Tax=Serratia sp. T13T92 TaxID=3397496 RepID=UPI0039E049DF